MIGKLRIAALSAAACLSARAFPADVNRPATPKHQLSACMTRQMAASRTISYNQATAVCKAQLKAKSPTMAATEQGKPGSGLSR